MPWTRAREKFDHAEFWPLTLRPAEPDPHATITGTPGDDVLVGTNGNDTLTGLGGNDVLRGLGGDDTIDGGSGNDSLYGDAGTDYIYGGDGDDRIFAGDQTDVIFGDGGDDLIIAGNGHDIARGGLGNDRIVGGLGRDNLYGDDGHDRLYGDEGADRVFGGGGNDRLEGGEGDDLLAGNEGHDIAHGGTGNDRILGGTGRDSLYGDDGHDTLLGEDGADRLFGGAGNDDIDGGDGDDLIGGGAGHDLVHGGAGDDRILGDTGRDVLYGDAGDDQILGGDGVDRLFGGDGDDELNGGAGNDILSGGEGRDWAVFSRYFADYTLSFVDGTLTISGPDGVDTLTGIERLQFNGQAITLVLDGNNVSAPTLTSAAAVSVVEGRNQAYVVAATDTDAGANVRYSLSGTDASSFDINSRTGVVTFSTPTDFETPGDTDGDNLYEIVVRAFDGANTADQAVTIAVTDGYDTVDLTSLPGSAGFIIQGDRAGDLAGFSVSSAGDVNGDGFNDVIVGAFRGDDGGSDAGEAYVVFGSTSGFGVDVGGRQVIDLTHLSGAEGFVVRGDAAGDFAGWSVSSAGDVNGDGYDDLIIGAPLGDDGGGNAGEAYVVFGTASGFGAEIGGRQVIDLTSLSVAEGFVIQGDAAYDNAGRSVSSAGDVNGDGYDDLIIGAAFGDDGGSGAGEAYVVFGSASGFGSTVAARGYDRQVIDLANLTATAGFIIQGDTSGDWVGHSVSSAGDVNGDGYDDLIVGAPGGDDGGGDYSAGEAYVVFGAASGFGTADGAGRQVIDLTDLSATQGFILQGDGRPASNESGDRAGSSVSSAGDVNGDGYDDLIAAAPFHGGAFDGEVYVIFGSENGFGTNVGGRQVIDVIDLTPSEGFVIWGGAVTGASVGNSVSSAGDFNGDGYDDLIVGGSLGVGGGAYVLFGSATGFGVTLDGRQVIDLSGEGSGGTGFFIQADASGDSAGESVSSAGDVNGDGFDDLIVGALNGDDGGDRAGEAYIIFGSAIGPITAATTTGTSGANTIIGGVGDDSLTGAGGADVIRGGAGDDVIGVSDAGFFRIDGGHGDDTLRLDGAGTHLDFNTIAQNTVTGIERIDLTGSGNNTLSLTALDLFDMVEAREGGVAILRINGNAGDVVNLTEGTWVSAGTVVEGAITYDRYTLGNAEVRIESAISVPAAAVLDPGKPGGDTVVMDVLDAGVQGGEIVAGATLDDFIPLTVNNRGVISLDALSWQRGFELLDMETPWGDQDHGGASTGLRDGTGPLLRAGLMDTYVNHALALPEADALGGLVSLTAVVPVDAEFTLNDLPLAALSGIPPGPDQFDVAFLPAETPFEMAAPDPVEGWQ
jgi:Ca2+-binding RTX toxin-like protein